MKKMGLMEQTEIILGLGTNLGDRVENLARALEALPPEVLVKQRSGIYQTAPWGFYDQPDFLNQVVVADTLLTPQDLLEYLKKIEKQIGRKPTFRYGPRQVDIDILFYGDQEIEDRDLVIPHPRIEERAFVLVPLLEVKPGLILPFSGKPIAEKVEEMGRSGVERLEE